jgi:hypothetical protein
MDGENWSEDLSIVTNPWVLALGANTLMIGSQNGRANVYYRTELPLKPMSTFEVREMASDLLEQKVGANMELHCKLNTIEVSFERLKGLLFWGESPKLEYYGVEGLDHFFFPQPYVEVRAIGSPHSCLFEVVSIDGKTWIAKVLWYYENNKEEVIREHAFRYALRHSVSDFDKEIDKDFRLAYTTLQCPIF